jgi:hypothetical protein
LIFEIESTCFHEHPRTLDLLKLAEIVLKGRHRIYLADETHPDYMNWKLGLSIELVEIWDISLELSMELEALEPAAYTIKVCDAREPDHSATPPLLNVEQATHLAAEPFRIFVENDDADRDFIFTFSDSQQQAKLNELEAASLVSFIHCGGIGDLPKKAKKFTDKAILFPKISAAVFDSDAPQPNEASDQSNAALAVCHSCGVAAFVLKRRAIENYLHISWLNTWANQSKASRIKYTNLFKTFCSLSEDQRSHFHMKKGLKADLTEINDGAITLYQDVDIATQGKLEDGFGSTVGSDLYSSDWVQNSETSEDQVGWDEVNGIVRKFLVLCR